MPNAPHISQREWIHWLLPGVDREEPTDTLVVTSAGNRFVDIRVFKDIKSEDNPIPGLQQFKQLEWAFAGTSSSEMKPSDRGELETVSKWNHWVDSNSLKPEEIVDEGTMAPKMNGQVVESGAMPHPVTGHITPYEECWLDLKPVSTQADNPRFWNVVLVLEDAEDNFRGMVVRVGHVCQGITREHGILALERWVWMGAEGGWKRTVRIGDLFIPCGPAIEAEKLELEGKITYKEVTWKVVELKQF